MGIKEVLLPFREEILKIANKYGAYNLRIFGSVARGEATPDSDVDFLLELEPHCSLFDYIALTQDLAALLGRKVDIAEPQHLHDLIKEKVLSEAIPL
ncbi:MAG: DNA polymerase subunit beta [Nostocales cyanobacterium]|nr:MAG: DNA polymerase subunit beta [Nostocales cyanobacterium]TAF20829.1 MAG: DNA polymerase subunit beta [Nostocales cyanobacterium]